MRYLITIVLIVLIAISAFASPSRSVRQGIELFNEENYEGALTHFRDAELDDPKSPIIAHNLSSALFQQARYDRAKEEILKAIYEFETTDSTVLSQLYYNLGNSYFRSDSLLQSIEMYIKALQYRPDDEDAKFNLELARALLKDDAEQQQQDQQQCDQQQQQQEQQEQDQDEGEDEQEQQDQQQQEQQQQEQQQEQQPEPQDEDDMTEEEARQILRALEDQEREQREEQQKQMPSPGRSGVMW